MELVIARTPKGVAQLSFQQPSSVGVTCVECGGRARLAFVAHEVELIRSQESFVFDVRLNAFDQEGYWPHDAIVVAVYFCRKCCAGVVRWKQA